MNTERQFKPGEHALLEVEIGERLPVSAHEHYHYAIVKSDIGGHAYHVPAKDSRLTPIPREGEYRLTVDELCDLTYHAAIAEDPWERRKLVKQWLANRKEAGDE